MLVKVQLLTTQAKDALKKAVTAALTKSNIGLTTAEANEHFDTELLEDLLHMALSEIMVQEIFGIL